MSTLLELVQLTKQRWRGQEPVSDTEWKNLIRDTNDQVIASSPFWPFLETETDPFTINSGSKTKTLPDETWHILQLYNKTDDIFMQPVARLQDVYTQFAPDDTGEPELYRLISNTLEVFPTPDVDTDFELIHKNLPARMTDSSQPIYPVIFHRILVDGALARAYVMIGNFKRADYHEGKFNDGLQNMQQTLLQSREDMYPTITDNWFGDW